MGRNVKLQKLKSILAVLVVTLVCVLPVMHAQAAPVAVPTALKQMQATSTAIQFGWKAVTGASKYGVSYSADGKTWTKEVETAETSAIFTNLTPSKAYFVKVRAFNVTWGNYSNNLIVSTAPKACSILKQTEAGSTSITVTWDTVDGATGYNIWLGKGDESTKLIKTAAKTTTSLVINGLAQDSRYTVEIVPFIKTQSGFMACGEVKRNNKVVTTAPAVTGVSLKKWNPVTGEMRIAWKNKAKNESGYEIQLINLKGMVVETFSVKGDKAKAMNLTTRKIVNKGGKARVRAFTIANETRYYGEWSDDLILVPTAAASFKQTTTTSALLIWKKVKSAKRYTIYYSTKPNSGYKKLATVGANVTSYAFTNMKENSGFYVYVVAHSVKVGKKRYQSTEVKTKSPVLVAVYGTSKPVAAVK
jgi:hypothetical protein